MQVTRIQPPAPPPPPRYTIELTEDEALGLLLVTGSIGGVPKFLRNNVLEPLWAELCTAMRIAEDESRHSVRARLVEAGYEVEHDLHVSLP